MMKVSLQLLQHQQHCNGLKWMKSRPNFHKFRHRYLGERRRLHAKISEAVDEENDDSVYIVKPEDLVPEVRLPGSGMTKLKRLREDRYRAFSFDEGALEALISETESGLLDLSKTYLYEDESGVIARPNTFGEIPEGPTSYKVLEWDDWVSGDVMSEIEEKTVLKKVYFVVQIDGDEYRPDFFNSYCLDASQRSLSKCEVIDESHGSDDPVMRILPDKILIQDSLDQPVHEAVSEDYLLEQVIEFEADLMKEKEMDKRWIPMPPDYEGTLTDFMVETEIKRKERIKAEAEAAAKVKAAKEAAKAIAAAQERGEVVGIDRQIGELSAEVLEDKEPEKIVDYEGSVPGVDIDEFEGGLDDEPDVPEVDSV